MSKRDIFHESVRRGLEKAQWNISQDIYEPIDEELVQWID